MNSLRDANIPGFKYIIYIFYFLIIATAVMVVFCSDVQKLSLAIKVFVLITDTVYAYIIYWLFRKKMIKKCSNTVLFLSVIVLGENIMTFL